MFYALLFHILVLTALAYGGDSSKHSKNVYNDPDLQLSPNSLQNKVDSYYEALEHFDHLHPHEPAIKDSEHFPILESSKPYITNTKSMTSQNSSFRRAGKRIPRAELSKEALKDIREKERFDGRLRRLRLKGETVCNYIT